MRIPVTVLVVVLAATVIAAQTGSFPATRNSEPAGNGPPPAEQSLRMFRMPPGFRVTLFAAEPDVQQPIAMAFDDRGRLWVVENYTYAEQKVGFAQDLRDRIVILEDTDHDGRMDKRTVFWDQGRKLTSVAIGFSGVWVMAPPHLLFLPDRNRDDVPDGEPVVVLDGWDAHAVRHNIPNGLKWGPDGWLYGRHGILANSRIGRPETPPEQRTWLNCSIWRYHPTRQIFEVVAHGTTNPWGFDYDDHGQMFFSNTVIGHLWHVIPGAHYKRMYGEDFNPHLYDLIDQHADHYHWDTGKPWQDSRDGKGEHGRRGGGHAHTGLIVYLGDNWPERYRNTVLTWNFHGRRLNNDRLERCGSGYVARHAEDLVFNDDTWFRGLEVLYGPDGGVHIADWSDTGECHDHDGVHRTSGRIYKVTFGRPKSPTVADVSRLSDSELVQLQLHRNDHFVRAARRNLQERAAEGHDLKAAHTELRTMFASNPDVTRKLRAMWALETSGGASEDWLREQLDHANEHVRAWAVRLLAERAPISSPALGQFLRAAEVDSSPLVRLFLASALQRLPLNQRGDLAEPLLRHADDAKDHNLPLMIWYGIEPLVPTDPKRVVQLAQTSGIPLVRRFIARRLSEDVEKSPAPVNELLAMATNREPELQLDVLQGMCEALRGWRKARPPQAWSGVQAKLGSSSNDKVRDRVRELAAVFGDGRALDELKKVAVDASLDGESRRAAIRTLLQNPSRDMLPMLKKLAEDKVVYALAVRGLAAFDDPETPKFVLQHFPFASLEYQQEAMATLVSRRSYASMLLQAIERGWVRREQVSAFHARQIRSLGDARLERQLRDLWGEIRDTPEEKRQLMARYKKFLSADQVKSADRVKGRLLFNQHCASCHTLFGEGKAIAPDITGGQRDNVDYLLENIVDPSATVATDFKMSIVRLKDGRVLTGVVGEQTERTLALQTQTEKLRIDRGEVEQVQITPSSLMADGLLAPLTDEQVRDLIAYLMSREQVALPGTK